MAKVKRSQFKIFLNTTPLAAATYSLIGEGVTGADISYNAETTTETYIHQDIATISVEKYAPTLPIEMTALNTDAVFEFLDTLRKNRSTLSDAETDILMVYLYEAAVATDQYTAEKQPVSIQIDGFGGDGGIAPKIKYTINFRGPSTLGLYDVSGNSFA